MKKIIRILLTIILITGVFCVFAAMASAQASTPEMNIAYCNLSFRDSVCIKYAVEANVSDVKILIWTSPETDYVVGTQDKEITKYYTEDIDGVSHMIFDYTELTAKQMTDVVYARAYAKVDGVDYYSEVNKYSILQYAYNMLGMTADASSDTEFKEMLTNMLLYGASAQKYFDYKEDRLATDNWYQVKLASGLLDDGCTYGLYLYGDEVTLIALETDAKGHAFSHWVDSNGNNIGTTATYELMVGTTNEIYTPIYEHNFGEWETVKEATTTEEGLMERVCGCGEKETQTIEKLGQELAYTLNADKQSYSVTGIGTWTDSAVVIPDTYKGLPVTSIAVEAFKNCTALIDITIPDSISEIGEYAFRGCTNLKSVYVSDLAKWCEISFKMGNTSTYFFSSNPLWLGADLYINGEKASSIIIPENVTKISGAAFIGCSSLTDITISDSVTSLGSSVFKNCRNLKSVTIGNGLTKISYSTFHNCIGLTNIAIPNSVTSIGGCAFYDCSGLTSITIPDSVTSIGSDAFNDCTGLTSITIPNSVTSIGDYAFSECTGLTSITIPNSVTSIGDYAFYCCSGLTSVTISDSITSIGDSTFRSCKGITSVTIPDGVTSIGSAAFAGCTGLTSVTFGDNSQLTSIGSSAFSGCTGLTSVTIPDSVTSIGSRAFDDCTGLTSVTFGDNSQLISIGDWAFSSCNLSSITIPHNVKNIESLTFGGCSKLKAIYITNIAAWCNFNLTNRYQNPICKNDCNLYLNGEIITDLIIPDGVKSINDYAFYGITSIENITIPDSVTSIGSGAFYSCTGLTSVTIPDSVTSIGSSAFSGCTGLTSVTFGDNSQLISIGDSAFSRSALINITIPNNATKIGLSAFFECSKLKNIIFKDTLTWYNTDSSYYSGGTIIDVTDSSANVKLLKYEVSYLYKK